ncbi:MAG TPA: type II CAAX endopeptidase family protein [Terracidiphilus sp.]|nr:type II CAAX endopeptidase family protein [Terracidiphilus sp.]
MTTAASADNRLRAYGQFVTAVLWFFVAEIVARHSALGLVSDAWFPLIEQAVLVFLLMAGYGLLGMWFAHQLHPVSQQGLPLRKGFLREAGMGLAVGWGVALVCVLPMALAGGISIVLFTGASAWGWLAVDTAFFALWTLGEEIAFRGYAFQRFEKSVGSLGAALGFAAYYAIVQSLLPGASRASIAVAILFSLVLSTAYLRTRALWLSWGLNFGWKASRALIFGLAVEGLDNHSPVVQGNPMAHFWLTGGGFGLDGTWIAFGAMLAALPVVFRLTRDLDFRYNAPQIVPAGIPVDLEAAARAQHEAAMGESAAPALVQIAAAPETPAESTPAGGRPDSQ